MQNKLRKHWIRVYIFIFVLLIGWNFPVRAAEEKSSSPSEAVIYGLDSIYTTISIPSDNQYPQGKRIAVSGTKQPTFRVLSKEEAGLADCTDYNQKAVSVSEDGVVTVGHTVWYNAGSIWTTTEIEGAATRVENQYGTAVIRVTRGETYQDLRIKSVDYSDVYYDKMLDAYIAENITPDMTELEKVNAITKYPASYDYSSGSTAKGMVILGGGDCWASTSLIVELAKKLGMKAWVRNANRDPGAGSGHRNALIESASGHLWYECEAGYNMSKNAQTGLRPYDVTPRNHLFSYTSITDFSVTIYQYDGNEEDVTTLHIPSKIDGKTVTGIASGFLYGNAGIAEVVLPETITSIGERAFYNCGNLRKLEIPASVTDITGNPFAACSKLTGLTINPGNQSYVMRDGILYTSDRKTLVAYPAGKTETAFAVPDGVETVGASAFCSNKNLKQIYIPDTVKHIGQYAFYGATALEQVRLSNALETIGKCAFYYVNKLERLVVPKTVSSVGQSAFYGRLPVLYVLSEQASYGENVVSSDTTVYCTGGASIVSCVSNSEKIKICERTELYALGNAANELTDLDTAAATERTTERTTEKRTEQRTTERITGADQITEQPTESSDFELHNPVVEMKKCDTVYFGSYWQEDTNGDGIADQKDNKTPIRWRILSRNGTDAYVIADRILDVKPYRDEQVAVTWEKSAMRRWLNGEFLSAAFTSAEQEALLEQALVNEDNGANDGGNNTVDKVYLPSQSDMMKEEYGFRKDGTFADQARIGRVTPYARKQGASVDADMGAWWWLRSPGNDKIPASYVSCDGRVSTGAYSVANASVGVRPVLHLNLSSSLVQTGEQQEIALGCASWDTVELGHYDGKPILWRVLQISDQTAFLLADQTLGKRAYHEKYVDITWKDSTLRAWLNEEFYNTAFSQEERNGILEDTYENVKYRYDGAKSGEATKDRVTLLSLEDMEKKEYGFSASFSCWNTGRSACGKTGKGSSWWLRSPGCGFYSDAALVVNTSGGILTYANHGTVQEMDEYPVNYDSAGVRPALLVSLSSLSLSKKGTVTADQEGVHYKNVVSKQEVTEEPKTETMMAEASSTAEMQTGTTTATERTTERTTEKRTTERTTEKRTTERTTEKRTTEWTTEKRTTERTTEKRTTEKRMTEWTTEKRATTERKMMDQTAETAKTTERITQTGSITEQSTASQVITERVAAVITEQTEGVPGMTREKNTEQTSDASGTIRERIARTDLDSIPVPKKVKGFRATARKKQLILKWTRSQDVSGYEIQISLKKNSKQARIYLVRASKKSYTVKKLKAGKRYYVRIRAYRSDSLLGSKVNVYGKWSTLKVKTKK